MRVCPKCSLETELGVCPDDGATTMGVHTPSETYAPGVIVNERYRIDEVIGIGGFGAVYKCTQANMDQEVAVKVLKSEHLTSLEHVKRFTREARAASKLKHPNTISIFDFGTHSDGALYLAMEYLHGETFANRMDEQVCMKPGTLVHIMTQICHSLTEAHDAGLIHRDLKPENIMLLPVAGDLNFVKVLDFGIAAFESERNPGEERLTEAGMIMGTPTYMSPEQARGETLDARSDIYALGVMMYEAVCGRVPFEGDQPMTVLVKHIKDPPEPPRRVAPEANIPRALEKVILRCLEKQPNHRPQTALELADALGKALSTPDDVLQRRLPSDDDGEGVESDLPTESIPEVPSATGMMRIAAASMPQVPGGPTPADVLSARPISRPSRTPLWLGLIAFATVGAIAVAVALVNSNQPLQPKQRTPEPVTARPAEPIPVAAKAPTPNAAPGGGVQTVKTVPPVAAPDAQSAAAKPEAVEVAPAAPAAPTAPRAKNGANSAHKPAHDRPHKPKAKGQEPAAATPRPAPAKPAPTDTPKPAPNRSDFELGD